MTELHPQPHAADPRLAALRDSLTAAALAQATPSADLAVALRYVLAILATDACGDACRFPRCTCPVMDCSHRPAALPTGR